MNFTYVLDKHRWFVGMLKNFDIAEKIILEFLRIIENFQSHDIFFIILLF